MADVLVLALVNAVVFFGGYVIGRRRGQRVEQVVPTVTDGWDVVEGDPWSVSCGPNEFTRVVRLRVGDFTIALTALSAHKLGSALHAASGLETTELDSFITEQGPAFAADVAQRVADASCCGTDIYWCPTAGRMECPAHSGFDVCCDRPERHTPLAQFEPQATALLNWWKENRQADALTEALAAEAERGYDVSHLVPDGRPAEGMHDFWHCRCGTKYNRGYLICPSCEAPRDLTPEEEHLFYADPANQEPQGPPIRRTHPHGDGTATP